jgi:hypothetical protein
MNAIERLMVGWPYPPNILHSFLLTVQETRGTYHTFPIENLMTVPITFNEYQGRDEFLCVADDLRESDAAGLTWFV